MADFYVSSNNFAAVTAFVASHAYSVGDLVKATAPAAGREYVFRCTTAGTSSTEPTWSTAYANNATITSGGATFTNVTGQSTYGWTAAAGTLQAFCTSTSQGRGLPGNRIFVASDHSENLSGNLIWGLGAVSGGIAWGLVEIISVNRAGSVPPVAADVQSGASITCTISALQSMTLDAFAEIYWQGITFTLAGTPSASGNLSFASGGYKGHYFKNCAFALTYTTGTAGVIGNNSSTNAKVFLDNCTVQFALAANVIGAIGGGSYELVWLNTASAIQGSTIPNRLFVSSSSGPFTVTCRGVDLSAIAFALCQFPTSGASTMKVLLESCKINSAGVQRVDLSNISVASIWDECELINCTDGTNVFNERWTILGAVLQDRGTYLTGGAQDDGGNYSLKMSGATQSANMDAYVAPLDTFTLDTENTIIGSSKTATVEIINNGAALNNNDISLLLEYLGTSGSAVSSFGSSLPTTILTSPAALTSSSNTWTTPTTTSWNLADSVSIALSGTGLLAAQCKTSVGLVRANNGQSSGKYYFEYTANTWSSSNGMMFGLCLQTIIAGSSSINGAGTILIVNSGQQTVNGSGVGLSLGTRSSGDIIGIAIDLTAGLVWMRVCPSGNWNGSGTANPATGTGGNPLTGAVAPGAVLFPYMAQANNTGDKVTANFGASSFSGSVPSGFTSGWPGSLPSTRQKLQVTFTPQVAGRVRGLVRLGKSQTTVWVNPQIAIV